ncbi:hypothetical protein LuPra_00904 [Luteitalea pratensis]|uniref:Uncharacterized protein n=1 Tax=Luteitalea pratensis TaxID=1855912 RepID=A0A143PIX8_LUTPR|nr:hypothetical protein [Luteitalea pratensis]AMY07724.1 hypothetical protein LuPra_00904 [Luteitalea pratensis]
MTVIRCLPLLLALLASTTSLASAQNKYCDGSQFDALTNMWKLEPDQNTRQVTAGELAAERTVMRRVVEMFKSTFVPTGAAGYYGVNYDVLPQALNKDRYGNTYIFTLSNHKIECLGGKPVALDVSLGNVSVQVNMHFVGEAEKGDSSVGFGYLPRGYYQLKDKIALPEANPEGIQEFNFVDGTTVWWLTRSGALPFRLVTRREFLQKQIEILRSRPTPSATLVAYYERMLGDASDDVAIVKEAQVPSLNVSGYVFTTLAEKGNRVYVTVNPDYYDRSLPKSAPQHILIRLRHLSVESLNATGNGARHLESFAKLREIVKANLAELRAMVK